MHYIGLQYVYFYLPKWDYKQGNFTKIIKDKKYNPFYLLVIGLIVTTFLPINEEKKNKN